MTDYHNFTDQDLLIMLNKGFKPAFTEIYERYWEKMARYAIRLIHSETEGADIVQEVFVSIWNRKEVLAIHDSLHAYLIKSTRNLCLQHIANNLRQHNFLESFSESMKSGLQYSDDSLVLKQLEVDVERAIEKLPAKMKEVYKLSRNEYLSHREIAQKLGIAEGTVKKQINYALKIISASIKREHLVIFTATMMYFRK